MHFKLCKRGSADVSVISTAFLLISQNLLGFFFDCELKVGKCRLVFTQKWHCLKLNFSKISRPREPSPFGKITTVTCIYCTRTENLDNVTFEPNNNSTSKSYACKSMQRLLHKYIKL